MQLNLSPTQVGFNARGDGRFNKPFAEQVDFFWPKLNLPTEHYDDILKAAHDRAFVVAGAMKADLLTDLRDAVDKSIADGKSIQWFRKEFAGIVQKHGWEGWTGSDTKAGRDWRTRVIYSTNLSASYSAGRYAQLTHPDLLKSRPYWKYVHNDTVAHPRPLHVSWSGMVLRHDDPFWQSHFPPNGWGCRCRITAVPASEYQGHPAPDDGEYTVKDRFGNEHTLPKGIDYGWDYAPGANTDTSLRSMVQDKLIRYKPAITKALSRDVNRYINASATASEFAATIMADKAIQEHAWLGFVQNAEAVKAVADVDTTGHLVLLPSDAIHHVIKHHEHDGKGQRLANAEDYDQVWRLLAEGRLAPAEANTITGMKRFSAKLMIDGELFRAIFELSGKKLRAISLVTLAIKTGRG
jgi:hypothetical protein